MNKPSLLSLVVPVLMSASAATQAITINYGEALQKSIYFYEAQQSGQLPAWNRVPWRDDSTTQDGSDVGVNLSGGWYDAGDHVKFGLPMATSATLLAWGVIENPTAYSNSGQMVHIKNNLRFIADYFVAAHPQPNVLYGQVGHGHDDHTWWGQAEVLDKQSHAAANRPSYAITSSCPGSDLAGETAAALAAISIVFKTDDPGYAATLESHARDLHNFAMTYRGKYSDCITNARSFYPSSAYHDELVWASAWLYKATGEQTFLNDAQQEYQYLGTDGSTGVKAFSWTHVWDNKAYGSYVLLSQLTGNSQYQADAERWLDYWSTGYNGHRISYTSGGFAQADYWGATRYAANTAFIALIYSDYLKSTNPGNSRAQTYYNFAVDQMEYIMGDNPMGHAYQIGISSNGPVNPHHRTAHGSWNNDISSPTNNRHLLIGALVGGPGSGDYYNDDRADHAANEVAVDYNAGFTGALARLYNDFGGTPIPDSQFPPTETRDDEFLVEARYKTTDSRHVEIAARVFNHTAWPARVTDNLTLRYWVDLTQEIAAGYSASDVTVSTSYHEGATASQLQAWGNPADNLYYTELSFAGTDLYPGHWSTRRKEVQFRLSLPNGATQWENPSDPSWDSYNSSNFVQTQRIAAYEGNTLVWGQEPTPGCGTGTGVNCLPTAAEFNITADFEQSESAALQGQDSDGTIQHYQIAQQPVHGLATLPGTGTVNYTPNMGFFGTDTFTYQAVDNQGGVSEPATVTVTVNPPIIPTVTIQSPGNGSDHVVSRTLDMQFLQSNAHSVQARVNGVQVISGVTGSTVAVPVPANTGPFTVELITEDDQGNTLSGSDSLTLNAIANTAPVADFFTQEQHMTVTVNGGTSTDTDGHTLTYQWDFGDNQTATGQAINHTYVLPGTYSVTLTVSDGQDSHSISKTVTVTQPPAGQTSCVINTAELWSTGVVLKNIVVTNDGSNASDWEVRIPVQDVNYVEQSWGQGTVTLEGNHVVARGTNLAAGATASFGFKARHNGNFSYEGCYDQPTLAARAGSAICSTQVTSEWHGGWNTNLVITNTSGTTLKGWQVSWDYADASTFRSGWSATLTGAGTGSGTATPASWNADIAPGQTITFGFTSDKASPGSNPPAININGHICQ